jgi:hypothetical protein
MGSPALREEHRRGNLRRLRWRKYLETRIELAKECSTHIQKTGISSGFWWESQKERDNKEELRVDGMEYNEMDVTEIVCGGMNCIR